MIWFWPLLRNVVMRQTFVFIWGEIGITLEDILVFNYFLVLGRNVFDDVRSDVESEKVFGVLREAMTELGRSSYRNASQGGWIKMFKDSGSKIEHEAVLALWLGVRLALAFAFLASVYKDLSFLKDRIVLDDEMSVIVQAPMQLVQIWIWERFPKISPKCKTCCNLRFARWEKTIVCVDGVGSFIYNYAFEDFIWQPYVKDSNENSGFSKLVGLDGSCIQQYLPHRVAMQFGMNQDVHANVARVNGTREITWKFYTRRVKDAKFYIPSRFSEAYVTARYLEWRNKATDGSRSDGGDGIRTLSELEARISKLEEEFAYLKAKKAEKFFDDVTATVLEEENRRNNREDRHASLRQVEALVVTRGRSMEPGSSGSHNHGKSKLGTKKIFKCYKYGKMGHFKKDCRGSNTSYPQGNVASTSDDGIALCCEAVVVNEGRKRFAYLWLLDTGATFHMTKRREWFHLYKPISEGGSVYSCTDHELKIIRIGSIMVKMHDGTVRTIRDVLHVEGLKKNLLSLGQLDDLGCKVEIQNKIMKVIKGALVLMRGEKVAANLYQLKGEITKEAQASVASHSLSHRVVVTWHLKLGHMSEQRMKILMERKLIPGLTKVSLPLCEYYVISKQHRLKFKASNSRSVSVIELVYSDVWQVLFLSLGGAKYFVSFIDDYSRRCWVYPIKKKSDVFEVFKVYKARVKLDSGMKIKCLRTDNGGEYTGDEFDIFSRQEGIKRQFTTAYTPQQNGVAERMNRTLLDRARAILATISLGKSF
ncbi:gag-pol polyprotein [Tanacetum coccineum]